MDFRNRLNIESKHFCTGCGACVQKCNKNALSLVQNEQGYYVAHFTPDTCVDCNLCEGVCPILYPKEFAPREDEPKLYATQMDDTVRSISSSGGVFSVLAETILKEGGVVFGASWFEDLSVRHIMIDDVNNLDRLRRSKYVQSYIGDTYRQAKKLLNQGRLVLYTGTPCQIAGLNAFLGKDYENLLTVDVLCLFAPSQGYFKSYLKEQFPQNNVVACNMRDKRHGWRCSVLSLSLSLSDGTTTYRWDYNDLWEKAFLEHVTMSEHCAKCKFPCHKRQGDLTIGDFWEIGRIDPSFDNLGTNSLIVNSEKGRHYFEIIKKLSKRCVEKPLRSIKGNRIEYHPHMAPHPQSERFQELYPKQGFLKTAHDCIGPHYDIAIMGCWEVRNYGSHLTYYALYKILKAKGYSIVFIGCPGDAQYKTLGRPEYFKEIPYKEWEMHPQYKNRIAMREANQLAETFIVGSDQLWDVNLYRHFGEFALLEFIHEGKNKIAYATSFGKAQWDGSYRKKKEFGYYLSRFDSISVRETSGIDICRDVFCVDAVWNLDPVFLCSKEDYNELARKSSIDTTGDYIAAYVLDCNDEKASILESIAANLNCRLRILVDPNRKCEMTNRYSRETNFMVEDWLKWIRDSKYVITDSFHGMCVSIKYEKQFVAIINERRGGARFRDYGQKLGISDFIYDSFEKLQTSILFESKIDYSELNCIIERESTRSLTWLLNAIEKDKGDTSMMSTFDIMSLKSEDEKIRLQEEKEHRKIWKRIIARIKRSRYSQVLIRIVKYVLRKI